MQYAIRYFCEKQTCVPITSIDSHYFMHKILEYYYQTMNNLRDILHFILKTIKVKHLINF